jgi:hypothetical protein
MTHYKVLSVSRSSKLGHSKYILVDLSRIILDQGIIRSVKKYGGKIPQGSLFSKRFITPLSRMESIKEPYSGYTLVPSTYESMSQGLPLPPIVLKPIIVKNKQYYIIVDGRHRVASSILKEYTQIPSQILR